MIQKCLNSCVTFIGLAMGLALGLSGCEGDLSPLSVRITARQNFDLISKNKVAIPFVAGSESAGIAKYDAASKRVTLTVNGQKVVFHKARLDRDNGLVVALPTESKVFTSLGERVGLETSRELICNPECQSTRTFVETRSCQISAYPPNPGCWADAWGRVYCGSPVAPYPIWGQQQVEVTMIERLYQVRTLLRGEVQGELGTAEGPYRETSVSERYLTGCW